MNAPRGPFEDLPARPRHVLRAEHEATETSRLRCPVWALLLATSVGAVAALVLVPPARCPAVVPVPPAVTVACSAVGGAA